MKGIDQPQQNEQWLSTIQHFLNFGLICTLCLSACGSKQQIHLGDKLLKQKKYDLAIAAYEKVLAVEPENNTIRQRIRTARRQAVQSLLIHAKDALSTGKISLALQYCTQARGLPLDLDAIELLRGIDQITQTAIHVSERTVQDYISRGHFWPAVFLTQKIVEASPGIRSHQDWQKTIEQQAIQHYRSLAQQREQLKLYGSAAIQLALSRKLGESISLKQIQDLWSRFTGPTCFADPDIQVIDNSKQAPALLANIETISHNILSNIQSGCGKGKKPLKIQIHLQHVEVVNKSQTLQKAQPLPGYDIQTEEVYFEEEPYTTVEEVTEYKKEVRQQEKRDCAPRPGKKRGCVTWVEKFTVEVPFKRMREVNKVRQIKKTRPLSKPLPADKVVFYDVIQVQRKIHYKGNISFNGENPSQHRFSIQVSATDQSNKGSQGPSLVIPADPLEIKSMSDLGIEAATGVAMEIQLAIKKAVEEWGQRLVHQAQQSLLKGQLAEAEELYLKLLALGANYNEQLPNFFLNRYGQPVDEILRILTVALGQDVPELNSEKVQHASVFFPKRIENKNNEPKTDPPAVNTQSSLSSSDSSKLSPVKTATQILPAASPSDLSESELDDLEKASMEIVPSQP